jgi:hypothetical protein
MIKCKGSNEQSKMSNHMNTFIGNQAENMIYIQLACIFNYSTNSNQQNYINIFKIYVKLKQLVLYSNYA